MFCMKFEPKDYGEVTTETGVVYLRQCAKKLYRDQAMLYSRTKDFEDGFVPTMMTVEDAKKLRKVLKEFIRKNK